MNPKKTPQARHWIGSAVRGRVRPVQSVNALAGLIVALATVLVAITLTTGFDPAYRSTNTPAVETNTTGLSQPQPLGPACNNQPTSIVGSLPSIAVLDGSAIRLIEPRSCRTTTLIRQGASGPLRSSADGRWIGYGAASAVNRAGTVVTMPLGLGIWVHGNRPTWAWSPHGDTMAGITVQGGLVTSTPETTPRTLVPDGWGATELVWAGTDRLVVARGRSLWSVDVANGDTAEVYQSPNLEAALSVAQAAPGWVVFWEQPFVSASAATDGAPLLALDLTTASATAHHLNGATVIDPAAVIRCGDGVAVMAGAGRDTTTGKTIKIVEAHGWKQRSLGTGTAPSCASTGRDIAFTRGSQGQPLGREQRHIVLIRRSGDEAPAMRFGHNRPGHTTDEAPLLGRTSTALLYVTTRPAASNQDQPDGEEAFQGTLTAAAVVGNPMPLTTIGTTTNYYGRYAWTDQIAVIDN